MRARGAEDTGSVVCFHSCVVVDGTDAARFLKAAFVAFYPQSDKALPTISGVGIARTHSERFGLKPWRTSVRSVPPMIEMMST